MDTRLLSEFMPGAALITVNAFHGLIPAAGAAIATAVAVMGWRYRRHGELPFVAVATIPLALLFLAIAVILDDPRYIALRPTLGSLGFAAVIAASGLFRPSLLRRSFGYKLVLTSRGWWWLHAVWIGLAVGMAAANEAVRRLAGLDWWTAYHAASGPAAFGLYWLGAWSVARWHWDGE